VSAGKEILLATHFFVTECSPFPIVSFNFLAATKEHQLVTNLSLFTVIVQ
jgi:hypothetical protein